MKRFIRYILAPLLSVALFGCSTNPDTDGGSSNGSVTFRLNLDIPGLALASRAMSDAQETAIDYSSVQVLIFQETAGGDIFRYKATITDQTPPTITVQVPTSRASEKYRVVVLVNTPVQTIADGTPKSTAMDQFVFSCVGKWNASSSDPAKIPMWGESATSFVITKDMSMGMLLHRALARVDAGTLFKFNNPDPVTGQEYGQKDTDKESVWGLDNFKITDIRVYRTRGQAYAASSSDRMLGNEVTEPHFPPSAGYNSDSGTQYPSLAEADQHPLVYTLPTAGESYLREIYIPESAFVNASTNMDNVPCLVVGGYYGADNTSTPTYYRADFATYVNGTVTAYRPVLRNHRYVFDIRSVSGPGAETPEEALNSVDSRLDINIIAWNEEPLDYYPPKHYYFNIESRNVVLDPQAPAGDSENSKSISYTTDLVLDGLTPAKSISYGWSTPETADDFFSAEIDYTNSKIIITALEDNTDPGAVPRSDVLTIQVDDIILRVYVTQKAFSLTYNIDCSTVQVHGKYMEGHTLDYSHSITLTVTSSSDLSGGEYVVKTIEKNGILFSAEGQFPAVAPVGEVYTYHLELQGEGTLFNESGVSPFESFEVTITTNSTTNSFCMATIPVGYKSKKILTIGANAAYRYGYVLEPNTASRAFVDAAVNFGSTPGSTVTMETNQYGNAFTIEIMTAGTGMIGEVIIYSYLLDMLNTFQPDIILTGQAVNYNASGGDAIQLLSDFVDAGGVMLMCNEYYPSAASIQDMVRKIMGPGVNGNNQSIGNNQLFAINGDADDPIVNGPFGDMRGLNWGADGHEMHGFENLPAGTIVYSTRSDGRANMFRHPTKGFFFMGEGGFISNAQRYIGGTYQGSYVYCPYAIDAQYRPIPRTNFGLTPVGAVANQTIYNSQIFGNLLTWAVEFSENRTN